MPKFWMDTNILISAKNDFYPFDTHPSFWIWLEAELRAGRIGSPETVFKEVVDGKKDELSLSVKSRKKIGLCIPASQGVLTESKAISSYIFHSGRYTVANALSFASGADPWLIAHAKFAGGTVVTFESEKRLNSARVLIPDVCEHFGISCTNLLGMIRGLGGRF